MSIDATSQGERCKAVQCRSNEGVAIAQPSSCVKSAVEEEEFTEALTDIIRRDFFPDVVKLEAAVERGHVKTPHEGLTVSSLHSQQLQEKASQQVLGGEHSNALEDKKSLSLDQFLSKYESEDDASFNEMLVRQKEANQQKHAWLHEKEKQYAAALALSDNTPLSLTDCSDSGRGSGVGYANCQQPQTAVLDSWPYTAKNSLMYIPDGLECSALELLARQPKTREIVHCNTRLSGPFIKKLQQVSATCSSNQQVKSVVNDKIGVDGKAVCAEDSPQIKGYGFLVTPQIHPGVDASPLMTWGSIEGTPLRLDSDSTPAPGPSFKLPKVSSREQVALRLTDHVAKANRARKKASMGASPAILRSPLRANPSKSERLRLLSPAARKLVSQRSARHLSDKALTASYSPRTPSSSSAKTPSVRTAPSSRLSTPHLTDNLLNLHNKHAQ